MLTVGNILACDGVLEGREGHILLEALSEILGTFSTNIVACEPASKGRHVVSTRAHSRDQASGGVLELFEARVRLESLAERPCALWTDAVVPEAVNGGQITVSWGADSREGSNWQRT